MKAYFVLCTVRDIHGTTWQQEPLVFSENENDVEYAIFFYFSQLKDIVFYEINRIQAYEIKPGVIDHVTYI